MSDATQEAEALAGCANGLCVRSTKGKLDVTDTAIATIAPDATEGEAQTGEVITPLESLVANERIIERGLKTYEKTSAAIEQTKAEVGEALYNIYTDKLWKARRGKDGKALFKNFGEYLESKGWGKTTSRAFQLMAEHRKALKAAGATDVVESKRGPKPNNPGRSAQTFCNMLSNLRVSVASRAEAMTGDSEGERDFVDIAERFAEATATFVSEWEALAERERGADAA